MRGTVAILLCLSGSASAATLRPYTDLAGRTVHLGDLFDGLGSTPDRVLGRAPAPGEKITVEAPQLAAIARDFGVDWRPETGGERAVLQRQGQALSVSAVRSLLLTALRQAGAPLDGDVLMPAFQPPVVGSGPTPVMEITQASFDTGTGRFTAMLAVQDTDGEVPSMRLSGQVISMRDAATLTRRLPLGHVITESDVTMMHVRAATLHGEVPLLPDQATGMMLKHDVPPGQPLTVVDLMRPTLVARGALVHMTLDAAGIALTAGGLALESGGLGERIRVQNPTSHAVVIGEVTGEGAVRVAPGTAAPATQVAVE